MRDPLTAPSTPPKSCLIIDQSLHIRRFVCANLGIRGFDVRAAETYDEGLSILAEWKPRLIVLELLFNVHQWWEDQPELPHLRAMTGIPVIVFTTEAYTLNALRSANPMVAAVLVKPVTAGVLVSTVMQVLRDYSWADLGE